jgi:hypothetical protein
MDYFYKEIVMTPNDVFIGYRCMMYDKTTNRAISGADSRCSIELKEGRTVQYGEGHFVTPDPEYAKTHYAVHDHNVLIKVLCAKTDIISGSLDDIEPEISIKKSMLLDWIVLD